MLIMKKIILLNTIIALFVGCSSFKKDGVDNQNQGIQIADTKYTDIIGNYINFLNDKNIEGVLSLVTDDIEVNNSNGNQTKGINELEKNLNEWLLTGDYKWRSVWGIPFAYYGEEDDVDALVSVVGVFDLKSTDGNEVNTRNLMVSYIFEGDKIDRIYAHTREFNPTEKGLVMNDIAEGNF